MKKLLALIMALSLCLVMFGCGSSEPQESAEPAEPLNLTGTWTQTNSNSDDSWMEATITDDVIEINWISDNGDTKSLYWAGTYDAPTEAVDEYSWTSENDTSKTGSALLASSDETKDFTYSNGVLSYEASAMGTTMTVKMEIKE